VLCILEAMKMENAIPAPRDGVVSEIAVAPGRVVQAGETLFAID
jgi:pyruvate carboxylase subunit B